MEIRPVGAGLFATRTCGQTNGGTDGQVGERAGGRTDRETELTVLTL